MNPAPPSLISSSGLIMGRNLSLITRNPASIGSILVFPLIFLFGFFAVLSRSVEQLGIDYQQYLPPVIVVQAMFFTGISSAFFLADDRATGMLERLRAMPLHRAAVVLGRVGADGARSLVSMAVVLLAGTTLGFRFEAGAGAALGFVALALLFSITVATGCAIVGLTAPSAEAASSMLFLPYLPLLMLSTGFVPLEGLPGWIQPFVEWQPVSLTVDALRALAAGGPTATPVLQAVAMLVALFVVFAAFAARAFRRAT
jgi:ABC-2 type transport system permease protein